MTFHIIIPARIGSTRLPGKPLLDIQGKPMIQRVYERALLCGATSVTVATDDNRIRKVIAAIGGNVCMTQSTHTNGTERLAEAAKLMGLADTDIVVNVQGDEPLFPTQAIKPLVSALQADKNAHLSTLCVPLLKEEEVLNPNIAKVVMDKYGYALYFSRGPIPWHRDLVNTGTWGCFRHVGIYAYRAKTLRQYSEWEVSPLEEKEGLEQLRILWEGGRIQVQVRADTLAPSVDTEADLMVMRRLFREQGEKVV